ncbi:MAG TPA: YeeE/YedE thiosulfate transporter family protein [Gemmatimonadaceae bacterium]|jgi:hypothetical protein
MTAPYFELGYFGERGALVAALVIGIAFGWCLESAGMGSARKLSAQFYLTDLTVFKVMFSAIVTAMLGLFWLGRLGVLDLSRVYVPETYILPQLVGGLIFGMGFALGGLCPGTSCVAAVTGRLDGAAVVLGMWSGVLATGLFFPSLQTFYEATPRGAFTLPQVFHLSHGVAVLIVVLVAISGFRGAEWIEGRFATHSKLSAPRNALRETPVAEGVGA